MQALTALAALYEDLTAHAPEIVAYWGEYAGASPWLTLPEAERVDRLPTVVRALIEVALRAPPALPAIRDQVSEAAKHGERRRALGLPEALLFTEYHFLREAFWQYLSALSADERERGEAVGAMFRLDAAITTATSASLLGYHRARLAGPPDRLPAALERLATHSPLLPQGARHGARHGR
jgi:hypothetical protein